MVRNLPLLVTMATAAAAAIVVACGSTEDRPSLVQSDSGQRTDGALPPDASPSVDSGPDDALAPAVDVDASDEPVACAVTPCAVEIGGGDSHFCARISDGTVRCWGFSYYGANGSLDGGIAPTQVTTISTATQIGIGSSSSCAVIDGGAVACWGSNRHALLGTSAAEPAADGAPHPTPSVVALLGSAVRVQPSSFQACATMSSGELWCWGSKAYGRLGRGPTNVEPIPENVDAPGAADLGGAKVRASSATVAITDSGEVMTWGDATRLGRETSLKGGAPGKLQGLSKISDVSAAEVACVIANGQVHCWGNSLAGASCTGLPSEPVPARAPLSARAGAFPQRIAVSSSGTCVRLTDGSVQCCGQNEHGQLGAEGAVASSAGFTPATAFKGHAVQIARSVQTTCALLRDGTIQCWGANKSGELGQGTTDTDPHPLPTTVNLF